MARKTVEYKYKCDRCGDEWTVTDPPPEEYKSNVSSWNQSKYTVPQPWPFTVSWTNMGGKTEWDLCVACHRVLFEAKRENTDLEEALEAIRLTQEYTMLPCREGWSWWDFYKKHRPNDARRLQKEWFESREDDNE